MNYSMNNFSTTTPLNMAPTGIATFAKTAHCTDLRNVEADIAILGAPFDLAIQGRTGCRMGPRGMRVASTRFQYKPGGSYDYERDVYFMDSNRWTVQDCGDVDYVPGDLTASCDNLREAVRILVERNAMPVILGGDCSVVYPMLQGMEGAGEFDIIHFDSHLDWTKPLNGQPYFNGSPMRNSANLPYVGRRLHIGIRGAGSSGPADFADAYAHGDQIYSVKKTREVGIEQMMQNFKPAKKAMIHFDIDVMDASLAPATGSPMFGGFQYDEMEEIFETISKYTDIIGIAMTEVAPPYDDIGDTTSYLAARLTSDMLNFTTKARETAK